VLVDPADPASIADGLGRVLDDPKLRAELVAKGLVRGPQFDWEVTGRRTAEVIEALVARPAPRTGAVAAVKRGMVRGVASATAVVTERIAGGFYKK
jgi:hypothetical protein